MFNTTNPIDMPVFFPFGRPGDFLVDKPRSTEDLVRKLYGDEVEFREIPRSVTYTEFAAPASDRAKFGPMMFGDAVLSAEDLALLPTQDDLSQPDRKQLIQNSEPAEDLLPPPEMTQDLASRLDAFDSEAAGYIKSGAINTNTKGRR
jgi:hypothetical protein